MTKPPPHQHQPASCYIFLHASPGSRVGMVMRGVPGFFIPPHVDQRDMTDAEMKKVVDTLNHHLRVSPDLAQRMYQSAIAVRSCQLRESPCVAA